VLAINKYVLAINKYVLDMNMGAQWLLYMHTVLLHVTVWTLQTV